MAKHCRTARVCLTELALAAGLGIMATPLAAWEFTRTAVCMLAQNDDIVRVRVTFDPSDGGYTLALTLTLTNGVWPPGDTFALAFDGPSALRIETRDFVVFNSNRTLVVVDRGFGNVLDGLAGNHTARAILGDRVEAFSLDGAAQAVEAFRDCPGGETIS